MINPTAPPTPAPMPMAFVLFVSCGCAVAVGANNEAVVDAVSEALDVVAVGPEVEVLTLVLDDDIDVVLALVLAPTTAPCNVKTALCVLQHLCLSASLSQQYFASSAYPWLPHCHTCTPFVLKSYALAFFGVSWFNWHCCGHRSDAQVLSVHVPRA